MMAQPTEQRYSYFDHAADVGIVGRGATVEAAFEAAAAAMFALMVDLPAVRPAVSVRVDFEEADPELALVVWLNGLLTAARTAGLVLGRFHLERDGSRWAGEGAGEPWREAFERGVEVKGATLTMLSVRARSGSWEARCVVDV
jgi:SHS2 domain-containing protein